MRAGTTKKGIKRTNTGTMILALAFAGVPLPALAASGAYEAPIGGVDFVSDLPPKKAARPETAQSSTEPPPPAAAPRTPVKAAPAGSEVAAPGNAYTAPERKQDELLILRVLLGDKTLADGIYGYPKQGSLILPLSDLVSILDFPIKVDAQNGRAEGWFMDENRLFSLDLEAGQVVIAGEVRPIDPAFVEQLDDDIYVDVRTLAQWFPIDIKFDLSNLLLEITSREPLPIEARLKRELSRERVLAQRGEERRDLPKVDVPYQWITWPVSDTAIDLSVTSGDKGPKLSRSYTTLATADFAKLNADIFLSGSDTEQLSIARLKLGRQNDAGGLLGDLDATQFAVGDVYGPQITHMARTDVGRGFYVSNAPIGQQTEFDRITLQGDLQLGWEVELYRNEVLLDFRESQSDGRYLFENVPLLFGNNVLKLVFYGPQGQQREEIKQIRVGPGQIKPGQSLYTFSAMQQDRLLLMGDADSLNDDGFQGKTRLTAQYAFGLTQDLSVGFNAASVPFERGHRHYTGINAVTSLGPLFTRADLTKDVSGGWAGTLSAQTNLLGITMLAEHTYLNDFMSEEFSDLDDPLKEQSRLRFDGVIRTDFLPHIPYALNITQEKAKSGDRDLTIQNRLSTAVGRASVSNTLDYTLSDSVSEADSRTVSGTAQVGGLIGPVRTRGQLSYNVSPTPELTTVALSGDWRMTPKYNARAGISRTLSGDQETTYTMGLNTDLDYVAVGVDGQVSDTGTYAGRMRLSYSWGKDGAEGGLRVASKATAERGTLTARVFRDLDGDGKFTEGVDEPLENIRFKIGKSIAAEKTNAAGVAYVTGIEASKAQIFEIDEGSLVDPFWIAEPSAVQVTLRPGAPADISFAVVSTGEIDGTIYKRDNKWSQPVSDVHLQLLNDKNEVVRDVKSQYDGFYLIDFIRPGRYTLRVDPEQLKRLELPDIPPLTVEIGRDGTVLNGQDFILGAKAPVAGTETARVVLASFPTRADAEAAWAEIVKALPNLFRGIEPAYEESGSAVTLFAEPFTDRKAAENLCIDLRAKFGNTWCNPLDIQIK